MKNENNSQISSTKTNSNLNSNMNFEIEIKTLNNHLMSFANLFGFDDNIISKMNESAANNKFLQIPIQDLPGVLSFKQNIS